jgi:hypothetical protein
VANTLAYYDTATMTVVKSFIVQAPDEITWHFFKFLFFGQNHLMTIWPQNFFIFLERKGQFFSIDILEQILKIDFNAATFHLTTFSPTTL